MDRDTSLQWAVDEKREMSLKTKLLTFLSIYALTLPHDCELWVLSERISL